jgi:ribonuclease J
MKLLLHLVRPQYFIPIHGELRHLKQHANIARQVGLPDDHILVIENGQVVEFQDGKMKLGERIPGGYIFVDGAGVGDIGPEELREREALARDGVVLVNLKVHGSSNRLREAPEIITRGFIYARNGEDLLAQMAEVVQNALENGNGNVQQDLQQTVKTFLFNKTKRRPMVFITISRT